MRNRKGLSGEKKKIVVRKYGAEEDAERGLVLAVGREIKRGSLRWDFRERGGNLGKEADEKSERVVK